MQHSELSDTTDGRNLKSREKKTHWLQRDTDTVMTELSKILH